MTFVIIFLLYSFVMHSDVRIIEKRCRENTLNNPYGNYMFGEPEMESCGDEEKAYDFNTFNLYENSNDKKINSHNIALRHYYTTPFTTYPNDSHAFTKFLMNDFMTCKGDNYCMQFRRNIW